MRRKMREWLSDELRRWPEWLSNERGEIPGEGGGPIGHDPMETEPSRDSGAQPGVAALTADPLNRFDGSCWVRSDLLQLRLQVGGAVYQIGLTVV